MNKRIMAFLLVIAVCFVSGTLYSQDQVSAPVFKDGDTWLFNIARETTATSTASTHGTYEVKFEQGKLRLFSINGDQREEMTISPDGPSQGLLLLVGRSEQRPVLKFPFSVGQKWSYDYEITPTGERRRRRRSVEVDVAGIESVNTSAGSFKAYKLLVNESWSTGSNVGGTTSTYFYSPDTGSMIKRSTQNARNPATVETELIKFTPGR